ncbi:GNAT family N-acetyltransferase [Cohnella sp. AR92]|uniref:GNAT family N-acetyltransferase n=1 Tax=Cohnella sp. AR92 TaxID=648716 RepID=UPI000F8EF4DD|nr:GNAT family N-acetyltransferase [Cohnella sp. AR92]RUS47940.1 N-acetyltransferase [Cohnella sp. AR92]
MKRIEDHFESFPILETDRILLRPITRSDVDDMYEYCSVPEVSRYTTWDYHRNKDDTKGFIDFVRKRYEEEKVGPWGIEYKETKRLIGSCSFVNWNNPCLRAEVGYVLSNRYWNMGIMTEVVRRILEFSFKELELVRVEARCHPDNLGSAKVMEKSGMKFEGLLRRYVWAKDELQDVKLYSIIKDELEG